MEEKWPFMLLVVVLLFGLGYVMATLERTAVMANWETRRCQLPVMVAARFFKPDSDPRTPSDFSSENFSFCTKTFVERFMELLMIPVAAIMGKLSKVTFGASGLLQIIRNLAKKMYDAFSSYLGVFFKKFEKGIFQLNRIIIYLRMAVQRMSATAVSMIYAGITLFRTMINSIQAIVRIVMIVCTIMLAIIIVLFFVLFPFIPIIISTLTAVVSIVFAFSVVMSKAIAEDADSKKSDFCFAADTRVKMKDGTLRRVDEIHIGDELADDFGKVTVTMEMTGENVDLYVMEGHEIYVTGSHLIKNTEGSWVPVELDPRAKRSTMQSQKVYCFNTTSNQIPVASATTEHTVFLFRDWEEMNTSDEKGQRMWNHLILSLLNRAGESDLWKEDINQLSEVPLMGEESWIQCPNGNCVKVSALRLGDLVTDADGLPTRIMGIVRGLAEDMDATQTDWCTEAYVWSESCWRHRPRTHRGTSVVPGCYLITEAGTFIRLEKGIPVIQRDFTEVGYDRIHETYSFVEARLR